MTNPTHPPQEPSEPIIVRRPRRISIAWLLPLLAIAAAAFLGWQAWQERGVPVWITFDDAAGLRVGNDVVYRGIIVGTIRDVHLAPEGKRVIVEAVLRPEADLLAREGTRFWIARPQVSLGGVTGLDTLIGPTYLNVAPAKTPGKPAFAFEGLKEKAREPVAADGGLRLVLRAARRGTVSVGSPIIYRDIAVGHVEAVRLADDARWVEIDAVIVKRYAHLVRSRTRFFKANGIGVDFGWFAGLTVRADSLEALVSGAIGFATPERTGSEVADGATFDVADEPDSDWLKWDPVLTPSEP
jgi:paraquat-inducible protein B